MGDILLSPAAKAANDERNAKIAEEQESNANRDFPKWCEDHGVIPIPVSDFRFQGNTILPLGHTVGFISTLRIPEPPKKGQAK